MTIQIIMIAGFLLALGSAYLSDKTGMPSSRVVQVFMSVGCIMFGVGLFLTLTIK